MKSLVTGVLIAACLVPLAHAGEYALFSRPAKAVNVQWKFEGHVRADSGMDALLKVRRIFPKSALKAVKVHAKRGLLQ